MLISKTVIVKWHYMNIKHYEGKGYIFTKWKDEFEVKVEDLSLGSSAIVKVLCDYCLEEGKETIIEKPYSRYILNNVNSLVHKDACVNSKCSGEKIAEVMMIKYGVQHVSHNKSIKLKTKNTLINRYGVDHPMKVPEFKLKAQETFMKNYGVDSPLKNQEIKDRIKATNLEKYGYEYLFNSPEIQDKIRQTNLERHGYENPFDNPEVQENIKKQMYINNACPTSFTQLYIYDILLNNYDNVKLNYPVKTSNLDIALLDQNIYLEYDGGGHNLSVIHGNISQEDFDKKEQRRWYALHDANWREIRIVSRNDFIPKEDKILEIISYCINYLNTGHSWIKFDVDEKQFISSQFSIDYDCGKLFKIKNNLEIRSNLASLKLINNIE